MKKNMLKIAFFAALFLTITGIIEALSISSGEAVPQAREAVSQNTYAGNAHSISKEEALKVIEDAYFTSIDIFNKEIDREDCLEDSLYCRPKDKNITYDEVLNRLKGVFTKSFITRGKLDSEAVKIYDSKLYLMLLEGEYSNETIEILDVKESKDKDTSSFKIKLNAEYGPIESLITLKKESGGWKVDGGSIFPQLQ